MTGRAGEATLSPVNTTSFDVPAPAGKGAWDTYSLQDEWVGEPMPIGAPVKSAAPAPQAAAPVAAAQDAARNSAASAQVSAPAREEKKGYVSPSLAHPGEWVGEPMPLTKTARQEEAPAAASKDDDRRTKQVEMPRTATGRLILKLLDSAGDRPAEADSEPLPGGKPDLLADLAAMPRQDDTPVQASTAPAGPDAVSPDAASPARPAEPQRAAAHLKAKAAGSSIMNFIAGAAEALRSNGHEDTIPARQDVRPAALAAERAPVAEQAASFAPRTELQAFAPPQAPVQPTAPRETDQTIPQLVARLDAAMDDAQQGFKNRRCAVVGDAANRIATESDAFGFRVLARMARCVERAAKANDMNALRDLLPELAVAVERNRIGLTPRR